MNYIAKSQNLIESVKSGKDYHNTQVEIASGKPEDLISELNEDAKKLVFWINVYNAFIQIILIEKPEIYHHRKQFFGGKHSKVAGTIISLDNIEHGFLRRSKWKYSFGYISNPFITSFEKAFRVDRVDPRIHFALNCGASSCPPIRSYNHDDLDQQLELATESYLETEINYLPEKNLMVIPAIFNWFRGDFGGKKGIVEFLRKNYSSSHVNFKISFKAYDWGMKLNNYV